MTYVYVVSYLENGNIEPIISVFDNEDAAKGFYDYMKSEETSHVWIDRCPLFQHFKVFD